MLVAADLAKSNKEARTLVTQSGISINGKKATDPRQLFTIEDLQEPILVKKGKKVFKKIGINE